jgi:hypothetical protein
LKRLNPDPVGPDAGGAPVELVPAPVELVPAPVEVVAGPVALAAAAAVVLVDELFEDPQAASARQPSSRMSTVAVAGLAARARLRPSGFM